MKTKRSVGLILLSSAVAGVFLVVGLSSAGTSGRSTPQVDEEALDVRVGCRRMVEFENGLQGRCMVIVSEPLMNLDGSEQPVKFVTLHTSMLETGRMRMEGSTARKVPLFGSGEVHLRIESEPWGSYLVRVAPSEGLDWSQVLSDDDVRVEIESQ